ncbi:MAG: fluoride efflux transporter CrcB, partial [Rubrobacter sp.]|nr:fluoride efflux transporter CrcB [Rubrobacter sp.]
LMVAVGGAIGAGGRYLLGGWLQAQLGPGFPWGTFVINVLGSLAIGLVLGISGRGGLSPGASLFLATGVLGGFTTFSAFSYETLQLLSRGAVGVSLLNGFGQIFAGAAAAYVGFLGSRLG